MKDIVSDPALVACCGLYCGACKRYLKGRCPGCRENQKATWCKVRSCCMQDSLASCADCTRHANPNDCRKFDNFVARIFAFVFRSNRAACIQQIRDLGLQGHADDMSQKKRQSIRK